MAKRLIQSDEKKITSDKPASILDIFVNNIVYCSACILFRFKENVSERCHGSFVEQKRRIY